MSANANANAAARKALNNAAKKKANNNAAALAAAAMTGSEEAGSNATLGSNANAATLGSNAVATGSNSNANASQNAVKGSQANGSQTSMGGRRRTKRAKSSKRGTQKGGKISKGASKWNQFVMRTFKDMRKKNKSVKLMDAMKECSKQKKKGVKY